MSTSEAQDGASPASRSVPRLGIWAWSFVGCVVALGIIVTALGAVSEIVLPLLFAAVLAVIFKPLAAKLVKRGLKPSLAAGLIVLGLLAVGTVVVVATAKGVIDQRDDISASVDDAIGNAVDDLNIDQATLDEARSAIEGASAEVTGGFVTKVVSGVDALIGIASGLILGALIMYYLIKDGTKIRRAAVNQVSSEVRGEVNAFVGEACGILRSYGRGRTIMSAIVAVFIALMALLLGLPLVFTIFVANFIGGYIPYIGAFIGGGLAVVVALGDGGIGVAAIMLVAVLASNLLLENFVEPRVMSKTLDIHPLIVLVATALGGFLAGIVGLILAVPFVVIAGRGIGILRSKGFFRIVADRAQPAVKKILN